MMRQPLSPSPIRGEGLGMRGSASYNLRTVLTGRSFMTRFFDRRSRPWLLGSRGWFAVTLVALVWGSSAVRADDWPQWLGPRRDGVWRETGILEKFPEKGPKVRWSTPIGGGYAGPAVAGNRVYVTDRMLSPGVKNPTSGVGRGNVPGTERILCLDGANGQIIWKHEYDCFYRGVAYPAGPRTTPVGHGGQGYTPAA